MDEKDLLKIRKAIESHKAKRVLIQAPEGMKTKLQDIARTIEKLGVEVVILADPCFGSCDIPDYHASRLDCDLILHFGHAPFGLTPKIPVVYMEMKSGIDPSELLDKTGIPFEKIGLVTTVQHVDFVEKMKSVLEKKGKKVFVGKAPRLKYRGQILGCNQDAALKIEKDVEAFLYVGTGKFHPLGLVRLTEKPVLWLDLEKRELVDLSGEKRLIEKKEIIRKEKLREAKKVGILVSIKEGQLDKNTFRIKEKLEKDGKNVWIIAMDYISPEKILGMNFDVLVNTACPRIEDDLVFRECVVNVQSVIKS